MSSCSSSVCPVCAKPTAPDFFPFCSKSCAYIDLGIWLRGEYRLAGEPPLEEPLSEDAQGDEELASS